MLFLFKVYIGLIILCLTWAGCVSCIIFFVRNQAPLDVFMILIFFNLALYVLLAFTVYKAYQFFFKKTEQKG